MNDCYYIDCIDLKSDSSGAVAILYYDVYPDKFINLTDGGYQSTSDTVISHIDKFYGEDVVFDNVIVTHNDNDHAGGLRSILEKYTVKNLWMLRPWLYADELIDRFSRYRSIENLADALREAYPNLAALEDIAEKKGIKILEPFQGVRIGKSVVLSPTKERFLDLIVESEKTPTPARESLFTESTFLGRALEAVISFIKASWGDENFSSEDTTIENEMSIVQFIPCSHHNYLLTGDVGRAGLSNALDYLESLYGSLPKIHLFEAPHHGSRRNLSTELLDRMFGPRLSSDEKPKEGEEYFCTIIQATDNDPDHPRKAVERALHHRGSKVCTPKGWFRHGRNKPPREGEGIAKGRPYPEEQEA
ncbi:conserved hypothetical protein [uncultured delta proteobacterium]|uniref:Metallo-beta-lactamase domain-containing protein n=1 Tax=uncultured delta proteobacterium TaxID=34034 RepID=A0A212K287_9DELT|nr:conserved hypothetical protein [uncultured delta proteobacterium]